jgi:antitoxin StbD
LETVLTELTVSMSEFKKNPSKILKQAGQKPVAVLNHNKASFYIVEPGVYEAMLEDLYDSHMTPVILERQLRRSSAITVDIDTV